MGPALPQGGQRGGPSPCLVSISDHPQRKGTSGEAGAAASEHGLPRFSSGNGGLDCPAASA